MKEKYEILRKFERMSKLGVPMRKRFTMDSPLEEMKMELEFIKREKAMDATIKQFSEWFVTGMSAMEWGQQERRHAPRRLVCSWTVSRRLHR
jgi:hypothetical protein